MDSKTTVEIADRVSRKRAIVVAAAAVAFLAGRMAARPFFIGGHDTKIDLWAINAVVLLVVLATGGGLLNRRPIRLLVNDEVSRSNYKQAVVAGYWVTMTTAMGLYLLPSFQGFTAREAVYIIVTLSVAVALLAFSYLEYRAHRDA